MKNIKKLSGILILLCFSVCCTLAQDFNNVKFIKNHDGDTFRFDLGYDVPELFRFMPLRLYGIDTPEINSKNPFEKEKAKTARDFANKELTCAKQINLTDCKKDKYFRILCKVNYDGKDLTTELLNKGYGYEYFGGKKKVIDYSK